MSSLKKKNTEAGFSLLELVVALVITMALMTAAATLLANALRMRTRENQKSDALADTQRAVNIMSREIANTGFNMTTNGIVVADSGRNAIRIRSNLNKFDYDASVTDDSRANVQDAGEDITYFINEAANTKYLARHDRFGNGSTVLANRIDSMNIHYFAGKVTYTAPQAGFDIIDASADEVDNIADAKYIVIAIAVTLDEVGTPGSPGYQPPYSLLLCSDITLRNTGLWSY
jgi:type II secretory pathway pseudopilin PulG